MDKGPNYSPVERVAALRAEKMTDVPFGSAGYYDFAFDGRLTTLTPWREELVEVEVAEKPR